MITDEANSERRLAVIQVNANDHIESNLKAAETLLEEAASTGAQLALLPENFALLQLRAGQLQQAAEEEGSGMIQSFLSSMAKRLGIWIIGGTLPVTGPDERVYNRCCIYDNKGQLAAHYDKIHLFDVQIKNGETHRESDTIIAGETAVVVETPLGKTGLTICYDLRFPELYRKLVEMGAELIVVPSAFTRVTGQAHWEVLLRARAIENQVYVAAAAQSGGHVSVHRNDRKSDRQTFGHSMIISPWGKIKNLLETGIGVITAPIDLNKLYDVRHQLPSLNHRKNII